uniref:Alpha-1,3-mannosyltransferase n=1 Tax=Kwoniella dejecticola CBS 10117 TaxID=1296121 RepID=A0A1A6AG76_9TREE|nr:uncharacterized protein I303_00865 [Kwoniella dejecticola CBS 10117]OBR89043.1 hypothetical protein I303_00865 [Kwoniella dejecticola CBS 10117]
MLGKYSPLTHISSLLHSLRAPVFSDAPQNDEEQNILLNRSRNRNRGPGPSWLSGNPRSGSTLQNIVEQAEDQDTDEDEEVDQDENDDDGTESETPPPSYNLVSSSLRGRSPSTQTTPTGSRGTTPVFLIFVVVGIGWTIELYLSYPFFTTIPIYVGLLIVLFGWTIINLFTLSWSLLRLKDSYPTILSRYSNSKKIRLAISTLFLIYLLHLGFTPPPQITGSSVDPSQPFPPRLPEEIDGVRQKYFIAANMHNNESVLSEWSDQLIRLIFHLGRENTYVSIYESNSKDSTKKLLNVLNNTLENLTIPHKIVTDEDNKHWWPFPTAVERIEYLANARNRAMEPIQSEDDAIRTQNYGEFTKIIFLNDIWFKYEDLVSLIDTRFTDEQGNESKFGDYDQVCAMDFCAAGLYDSWVARDVCGTPMRTFWPHVKDPISVRKMEREETIQASACWNGVTVLDAKPFLYQKPAEGESNLGLANPGLDYLGMEKRGWRMIDNSTYPGSVSSPSIDLPIKFRTSEIAQCDHSECFLISYDLHRYHHQRPVKIYMNPKIKVAYEQNWFKWHTVILRVPIINWWLEMDSKNAPNDKECCNEG